MIRFGVILAVVIVAIGLLVGGIFTSSLLLVYLAIGVSALAAVLLVIGVVVWRDELFGETAARPTAGLQAVPAVVKAPALDKKAPAKDRAAAREKAPSRQTAPAGDKASLRAAAAAQRKASAGDSAGDKVPARDMAVLLRFNFRGFELNERSTNCRRREASGGRFAFQPRSRRIRCRHHRRWRIRARTVA